MARYDDEKGKIRCSFCGKPQVEVKKLIAGPVFLFVMSVLNSVTM